MRLRDNVLLQYTVATLVVILLFSAVLGQSLIKLTSDLQIKQHLDLYPQISKQLLSHHPDAVSVLANNQYQQGASALQGLVDDLLQFENIFRVKLWGQQATVLWSDDPTIIGKQFPNNDEFFDAWQGNVGYSVSTPENEEQQSESDHKLMLEVYSPIVYQGQVVGVLEIYEATDFLFAEISRSMQLVWWAVGSFGLLVYVALFIIFYQAHMRQQRLIQDLNKTQDLTILALASVTETRDKETGRHILRTGRYMALLANDLRHHPRFKHSLSRQAIETLVKSCPLHDIGKVGVPDHILLKPGALTPEEFEEIMRHPEYGRDALTVAERERGANAFLEVAKEIAYSHHEKWDGSGYPLGLRGDGIPLSGRLMALADVYDALISERVYKPAFPHQQAVQIIEEGRGQHFDPDIVDAFMRLEKQFEQIAIELAD